MCRDLNLSFARKNHFRFHCEGLSPKKKTKVYSHCGIRLVFGIHVDVEERVVLGLCAEEVNPEPAVSQLAKANVAWNRARKRRELFSYVLDGRLELVPGLLVAISDDLHYLIDETVEVAYRSVDLRR